ncbi:MAG: Invasion associated locus B family protein [Candidatus Tokpelaia sp. JSC189]|nr:MAG: Invasion associated locus B family protein [Candidatus Tokpelaia sp. JSC189]
MPMKKTFTAVSVVAGAAVLFVAFHAPAFAQSGMQGWYKVCSKQQAIDVCNTMNNVVSDTGQYLTMVNLIEVTGKQNQKRIGIQVPTGRLIPEGVKVKVDNGKEKIIPYMVCNGPTCIANDVFDDTLINMMKKGTTLTISSVNFQGTTNPIEISLKGFSQAFTGLGIREQDFQAEQEKLQKAIQAKQQEIENKMRAEQEKAKTGS